MPALGHRLKPTTNLEAAHPLADGQNRVASVHAVSAFNLADSGFRHDVIDEYAPRLSELARTTGKTRRETWALGTAHRTELWRRRSRSTPIP